MNNIFQYILEELPELVELFLSGNPFCDPDGPMPHYHSAIQAVVPDLEIIDGVSRYIDYAILGLFRPNSLFGIPTVMSESDILNENCSGRYFSTLPSRQWYQNKLLLMV